MVNNAFLAKLLVLIEQDKIDDVKILLKEKLGTWDVHPMNPKRIKAAQVELSAQADLKEHAFASVTTCLRKAYAQIDAILIHQLEVLGLSVKDPALVRHTWQMREEIRWHDCPLLSFDFSAGHVVIEYVGDEMLEHLSVLKEHE